MGDISLISDKYHSFLSLLIYAKNILGDRQNFYIQYNKILKLFWLLVYIVIIFFTSLIANSLEKNNAIYTTWNHALSMDGKPKHIYATHFPYANPRAIKGGVFKIMGLGGFDSLDLFVLKGSKADSLNLIYDTLMVQSLDEPYAIYPLIADKISIANNKSGVRFHINPLAKFHDGSKILAEDVKFSFDMLIERGDPTQARYYADVKEAIVINDSVIEFRFKTSENKELPFILTQLFIFPKSFYMQGDVNTFGTQPLRVPMGSGPYKIYSFDINTQITYERNPSYWAQDLMVNQGVYNFDKVIVEYYKDENVALRGFLAGNYDYRFEPQAKSWANDYKGKAYQEGNFNMFEFKHGLPAGMQGFYLNTRKKHLQDKRVREAITQAFDFEWSNQYLFYSQYKRTTSYYENSKYASRGFLQDKENAMEIIILESLGILEKNPTTKQLEIAPQYRQDIDSRILTQIYTPPSTKYPHSKRENLKYAKKLLEDAGYYVFKNQLINKNNEPLKLTILLNSTLFERIVLPFKKNLAILGIMLDVHIVDSAQYENRVKSFDYDIIVGVIPQSLFPGNEQDFFFSSLSADMEGSRNFSGIKNKAIDFLITQLNQTEDMRKREAILHVMDRILLWGFYVIPHFYSPNFRIAIQNNINIPKTFPIYGSPFSMYYYWWKE